ncbi:MAG: hypothetical protein GY798_28305 [Hyphomicrobiales bacterium]|nr:hypothetical protein [Hyphomicrobiales bacterium]
MGYGGWRETRHFRPAADAVYEHLLGVLQQVGYEIDTFDSKMRGVVAHMGPKWSFFGLGLPASRVAASVTANGDAAMVTTESAPHYVPQMFGTDAHRRQAGKILDLLQQALDP